MRVAVISDIHGNLMALEAVLADIAGQSPDAVVCLGDHVSGPGDPRGVAERLIELDIPSVRGNHDRFIVEGRDDDWDIDILARDALDNAQMAWMQALPLNRTLDGEIFLCHGTPRDDDTLWLERRGSVAEQQSADFIEAEASGFDFPLLLCGHSHVPRAVPLADRRLVVNPGSVGLPFMLGSPDPRYAIVERRNGQWAADLRTVPYDHFAAAEQARTKGFDDWSQMLITGWSSPGNL
jgi:putative phosphoesterase